MGHESWSTSAYEESARARKASGKSAFDHDARLRSLPSHARKAHPTLDPLGVRMRESRDSDEHPESLAIAVFFDVTGSMGSIPRTLMDKLPDLNGLLVRKGLVDHPQIMFGGIGDIRGGWAGMGDPDFRRGDRVPLQVGQFESGNQMDDNLGNLYLEGGGNGQKREGYEMADYFIARHTDIDCFNIRNRRGYLFTIGDEMSWGSVNRHEVKELIGDQIEADIPMAEMIKEVKRRYHRIHIYPEGASYDGDSEVEEHWRGLLGEDFLKLDDPNAVCELIAGVIGIKEGSVDLAGFKTHLTQLGITPSIVRSTSRALARMGANLPAKGSGNLPSIRNTGPSPRRL